MAFEHLVKETGNIYRPLSEASEGYVFTLYVCPQGGGGVLSHNVLEPPPPPSPEKILNFFFFFWRDIFSNFFKNGDTKMATKKNGDKKKWRRKGGGRGRYASCGHAGGLSCLIYILYTSFLELYRIKLETNSYCRWVLILQQNMRIRFSVDGWFLKILVNLTSG